MVGYPSPIDVNKSLRGDGTWSSVLNASLITVGSLPIARLTNYPSNTTTFLRGDGTWIIPPNKPYADDTIVYTSAVTSTSLYFTNKFSRIGFKTVNSSNTTT